jgi:5-methyltetrahydrofolate--homocysteine methyltransferase
VKIAPEDDEPVVHVLDASRAAGVVAALLDPRQRPAFDANNREEQQMLRALFARKNDKPMVPLALARANRTRIAWRAEDLPAPAFLGRREVEVPLAELVPYIDWTFFFTAWELTGKYPAILDDPDKGHVARDLFDNAQRVLRRMIDEARVRARGVYGFWPALSDGDDLVLYADEARTRVVARLPMLRQQQVKPDDEPHRSLADFVLPRAVAESDPALRDHVGAFAVTAGLGLDPFVQELEHAHEDYDALIAKALCDRLAEAFAEKLHERARAEWGHGEPAKLSNEELIAEKYRGIRPAFGYPACPDHTRKGDLFELLDAPAVGLGLTESFAMTPAASVSGLYLAHPDARYFMVRLRGARRDDRGRGGALALAIAGLRSGGGAARGRGGGPGRRLARGSRRRGRVRGPRGMRGDAVTASAGARRRVQRHADQSPAPAARAASSSARNTSANVALSAKMNARP